ncbi:MAG: sigma 54-interacting transcriptional regulator [Myxococcota bacterium]
MTADASDLERLRKECALYQRLLELGEVDDLGPFLEDALSLVVEVTGAEQGYLEVRDVAGDDEDFSIARGCSQDQVEEIRSRISRGIIAEAMATGRTVVTHSALLDDRFRARESVQTGKIEAVLCAPLGRDAASGVVYLEGRAGGGRFSEEDVELAERFARHLAPSIDRLFVRRRYQQSRDATAELRSRFKLEAIVGRSRALAEALEQAMLAAPLDVTILITGPSGSGKTQLAHAVHANSRRAAGPFIQLNCAAIPQSLIESELFGARAGSHSEARRDLPGKVEAAESGTLFLDEIGELPLEGQAKLLQLLQDRQYFPLGATRPVKADLRLIAASNADLQARVADKSFREDLYYRINVIPVRLPALRERPEDLADLARELLANEARDLSLPSLRITDGAVRAIEAAEWPGNVRELQNALRAAAVRAAGTGQAEVTARHVFPSSDVDDASAKGDPTFQEATRAFQRDLVARTLEETGWNVRETAQRLDIARSYVYQLIQTYGLRTGSERDRERS